MQEMSDTVLMKILLNYAKDKNKDFPQNQFITYQNIIIIIIRYKQYQGSSIDE